MKGIYLTTVLITTFLSFFSVQIQALPENRPQFLRAPGAEITVVSLEMNSKPSGTEKKTVALKSLASTPQYILSYSYCAAKGGDDKASVYIDLKNSSGDVIMTMTGCSLSGVSNETGATSVSDLFPIPKGVAEIDLRIEVTTSTKKSGGYLKLSFLK